jgi:cell division protein FtsB
MPARTIDLKTMKISKTGWLIAILISTWTIFSPWGAIRYYRLSNDLDQLKAEYMRIQNNNRQLKEEIDNLTTNQAYIEKVAREQYGLLKSNEFLYKFPNTK